MTAVGGQPKPKSPPTSKVSEQLADRLRGEIANGVYRPGQFLPPEALLMSQYGVGRPSMREALRILESDGLIRIVRGASGGVEVLALDPQALARRAGLYLQLQGADLADIRTARDFIDPGAVRLAAERRDPNDVARLREIIAEVSTCRSGEAFGGLAADFVECLLVASGNRTLALFAVMIDRLMRQEFLRYMHQDEWSSGEKGAWFAAQWTIVVDRIAAGDADGAEQAWAAHRTEVDPTRPGSGKQPLVVYPPPAVGRATRPD